MREKQPEAVEWVEFPVRHGASVGDVAIGRVGVRYGTQSLGPQSKSWQRFRLIAQCPNVGNYVRPASLVLKAIKDHFRTGKIQCGARDPGVEIFKGPGTTGFP